MTTRKTISVPLALRKKMDRIKGTNWSAIASQAFAAEVERIRPKKKSKDLISTLAANAKLTAEIQALRGELKVLRIAGGRL